MFKTKVIVPALAALGLLAVAPAQADELADEALGLCEKVKSCALAQMNQSEITPQMRQMIQPTLDTMCDQVTNRVGEVPQGHAVYASAVACMRSMRVLSCEDMVNAQPTVTPACREYEEMARRYGEYES